ncbi:MAG: hypothetical protein JXA54_10155 [Candidatus Heimdallarchaeota archaeon]|nr:hypothetical protein [Candidatus Heimdallarchaeota archaeon]
MSLENDHNLISPPDTIGLAIILMEDLGPQTCFNISTLNELSAMYLAVKGFTAFMTGFERADFGPGKIRGILQIPETEQYAVALDLNMRGSGFEEDPRLQNTRTGVICLIANEEQLSLIRKFYKETENFLVEKFKAITTINHLNEAFCLNVIAEYNNYLKQLEKKIQEHGSKDVEQHSLYDISVLLALPKEENFTARAIMESSRNKKGITLEEISKLTKRKTKEEQKLIDNLLEKGLIIAIPPQSKNDTIRFIAK